MFGRERELAVAGEFLDHAPEQPTALLVEGDPGAGKTTIWQAVVERAEATGFRVLQARPAEAETKLALSAVADLYDDVPASAYAALPAPQRASMDVALLRVDPGSTALARRTLAAAVRNSLGVLAAARPLLVAVDDVHWLDAASAAVLRYAMRRLRTGDLRWLLARRTAARASLAPDDCLGAGAVVHLHVTPLGASPLRQMLCERFDRTLGRPALMRIVEASGGNPLHALEIARELAQQQSRSHGTELPVPADLQALVGRRLRRLPTRTRNEVLAAAALAAPEVSLLDEDALAPAEEADLVHIDARGRITFTHPLIASAVYRSASTARRRKIHAGLAPLVADTEQRARHLALAATDPDEHIADLLVAGATLARRRGSWEAAAELLERAHDLTPAERRDEATARLVAAAEHHAHAGDRARARVLLEQTLDPTLDGAQRAAALRVLAEISYHDGNFVEARRLYTEALAHADDLRLAAVVELGISYTHSNTWDHDAAATHAARAHRLAAHAGDPGLIARTLAHVVMYDFLCGRSVDWTRLERAVHLEDTDAIVALETRPTVIAALLQLYVGQHGVAREHLRAIADDAADRGDESDLAFIMLWRSWLETRAGDYRAADDLVDQGLAVAALTGSHSTHAWLLAERALIRAHRGDVDGTRRDCAEVTALLPRFGNRLTLIWVTASLALLELSLGDPHAAWAASARLTTFVEEHGVRDPAPVFFLPDALEALIAIGELDRADGVLRDLEARADALDRVWAVAAAARCRALLQAARGDLDGALAAVDRSRAVHSRIDMPFEAARTHLVAGAIERRCRRRAAARASFEDALARFEHLRAPLWADQARRQLDRTGTRRSSGDLLTPTERRVAELAARGLTNREVAARLFISPKTVESNLARVYRKLGIMSRAELGGHMARAPQP